MSERMITHYVGDQCDGGHRPETITFSVSLPPVALRRNSETGNRNWRAKLVREWQEEIWCAGAQAISAWTRETDRMSGQVKRIVVRAPNTTYAGSSEFEGDVIFLPWPSAHVHYAWHSTHPTDADNIIASCKPLLDVLKATGPRPLGILVDDGPGVTVTAEWVRESSRTKGRIEVVVEKL